MVPRPGRGGMLGGAGSTSLQALPGGPYGGGAPSEPGHGRSSLQEAGVAPQARPGEGDAGWPRRAHHRALCTQSDDVWEVVCDCKRLCVGTPCALRRRQGCSRGVGCSRAVPGSPLLGCTGPGCCCKPAPGLSTCILLPQQVAGLWWWLVISYVTWPLRRSWPEDWS